MNKLRRIWHILFGHNEAGCEYIERLVSKKHPQNDKDYAYVIYLKKCKCGLIFTGDGMESYDFIESKGIYSDE